MLHRRFFSSLAVVAASVFLVTACGPKEPLVLSVKSSQAASGSNRASPTSAQNVEDANLAYAQDVSYSVLNELPDLGESGEAWSVNPLKQNIATLKKLAVSLGLSGEVVKENFNNFSIGRDDKTGAGLQMYVDVASAWWNYSSGSVGSGTTSSAACTPNAECADANKPAEAPILPANLPDEATAIERVTQLLKDSGLRIKTYALTATRSDWSTEVVGTVAARDVSSNLAMYVSFGAEGKITYASGPLIELKYAGTYPLVSPKDAVKRLSQVQYGLVGPTARSAMDMAVSSPVTDGSVPVAITVPITGVRLALMQITLTNNSSILMPAYTFTNADGDVGTVLAVEEKYLSYGDSEVTDGSDPVPTPVEPGTSGGSPGVGIGPVVNQTEPMAALDDASSKKLIGLTEAEAQKVASELGWQVRVAMRDGEAFMLTQDYQTNRVNLTITKGFVTAVVIG
jgi:predicted small lipoprotein YifL